MAGKASPLRVPPAGGFKGKFYIRKFDISNDKDRDAYELLRTRANDGSSGVTIESIRDLNETTEVTDSEGMRMRNETWYIVVQWWEDSSTTKETTPPSVDKGFYVERALEREPKEGGN